MRRILFTALLRTANLLSTNLVSLISPNAARPSSRGQRQGLDDDEKMEVLLGSFRQRRIRLVVALPRPPSMGSMMYHGFHTNDWFRAMFANVEYFQERRRKNPIDVAHG